MGTGIIWGAWSSCVCLGRRLVWSFPICITSFWGKAGWKGVWVVGAGLKAGHCGGHMDSVTAWSLPTAKA